MVEQVQIPHSVVEGKEPLPGEVVVGGLAVNLLDFRLYTKGYNGVVIRLSGRVEIEDDLETNATVYLPWVKTVSGNVLQYTSSEKLSFNPSTGQLSATSFAGSGADLTDLKKSRLSTRSGSAP
jgi:hypothetical protein